MKLQKSKTLYSIGLNSRIESSSLFEDPIKMIISNVYKYIHRIYEKKSVGKRSSEKSILMSSVNLSTAKKSFKSISFFVIFILLLV